jgi:hypothetical protein
LNLVGESFINGLGVLKAININKYVGLPFFDLLKDVA